MRIVDYVIRLQDRFSGVLGGAGGNVDKFEKKVGGLQSTLGKLAGVAAGAFAFSKIYEFGQKVVEAGANMEQTRVRFEALTGSAEKASDSINKISKLATETPFAKSDLLGYGQSLIGAGLDADQMAAKLKTLGNISSATGKNLGELTSLYVKNKGNGLIQGEDLNQLADAKIPLDAFAKQLGTNVQGLRKLGSEGKVTFQDLDKYFESLGGAQGKWGDMNEKLSKTLAGRWSNFQDTLEQMVSDFGESKLDLFGGVLDQLQEVADWVSTNKEKIANLFQPLAKAGQRLMGVLAQVRTSLGLTGSVSENLDKAIVKLQEGMDFLGELITPIVDDLGSLWTSFTEIYKVINEVYGAFNNGRTIGQGMKQSFREISIAIQLVVDGITTAIGALAQLGTSASRLMHGDKLADIRADNAKFADKMSAKWEGNFQRYAKILNPSDNGGAVDDYGADGARDAASKTKSSLATAAAASTKADTKTSTKIGDVAGTKPITINLTIKQLTGIGELHTTNLKGSLQDVAKAVQELLGAAVTDTMILAQNNNS